MLNHPDIDPIAVAIGPISVHWYGIMYLLAFASAWALAIHRTKRPNSPLTAKQVEDLIVYGALGVVLGGRFGYVMFYNFGAWLEDPLWLFRVWEGGMSFHGGLLGVIVAIFIYGRKIKVKFPEIIDFTAVLVPVGLGFGRIGNFIGQELWGRETDVSWGMIFPRDPDALVRHPSQLYQAFLEGLVLFVILYWFSQKPRPRLAVSALFLICYGVFRFAVEFVRAPDAHIPELIFGWMTRGQLLTIPLIVGGLGILIWAYTKGFGMVDVTQENHVDTKASKKHKKVKVTSHKRYKHKNKSNEEADN
jgi:phosphatidylglycerol:prolipoprotein diacylglycerol transferase